MVVKDLWRTPARNECFNSQFFLHFAFPKRTYKPTARLQQATEFSAKAQQTATELSAKVPFIWLTWERRSGCGGVKKYGLDVFFSNGTGWAGVGAIIAIGVLFPKNIAVGNVCPQKGLSTNQFSKGLFHQQFHGTILWNFFDSLRHGFDFVCCRDLLRTIPHHPSADRASHEKLPTCRNTREVIATTEKSDKPLIQKIVKRIKEPTNMTSGGEGLVKDSCKKWMFQFPILPSLGFSEKNLHANRAASTGHGVQCQGATNGHGTLCQGATMTAPNDGLDGQMVKYGLFVFIETWVMSRIASCLVFYLEKVTNMIFPWFWSVASYLTCVGGQWIVIKGRRCTHCFIQLHTSWCPGNQVYKSKMPPFLSSDHLTWVVFFFNTHGFF